MRKLLHLGLPISGASVLEYGVFGAAALLMGKIGTTALAAHQIALQVAAIMFMVPLGISLAATVRVGHATGRDDVVAARRAGFVAIGLGLAFMAAMTLLVALTRHAIPQLFLGEFDRRRRRRRNSPRRCCWSAPASSWPTGCRWSPTARCAAATTRASRCCSPRSASG